MKKYLDNYSGEQPYDIVSGPLIIFIAKKADL